MTADDVREQLRLACEAAGGQAAWARLHGGQHAPSVSTILAGKKLPSYQILVELGLRRVVEYEVVSRPTRGTPR